MTRDYLGAALTTAALFVPASSVVAQDALVQIYLVRHPERTDPQPIPSHPSKQGWVFRKYGVDVLW